MSKTSEFIKAVHDIAARSPTYRTGGTGADGTCDCIGLVMGAMYALGHDRYDLHSTNYFARHQMESLDNINVAALQEGMLVYKARESTEQLNARYQPGGRYYTGDMLDYYHVGVVESTIPPVIVHCTESGNTNGIKRDYSLKGWTHAGVLKGLDDVKEEEPNMKSAAMVIAQSGENVNMRTSPNIKSRLIMRVPIGTTVTVLETARNSENESWSKIENGGYTGYMMSQYLKRAAQDEETPQDPSESEDEVRVTLPKNAAEAILMALMEVLS